MRRRIRCNPLAITFVEGAVEQALLERRESPSALGCMFSEQNIKQCEQLAHFFGQSVKMPFCRMLSWRHLLCMWQVKRIERMQGPWGKTQALSLEPVREPHIFSFNVDNECLVSQSVVFYHILASSIVQKIEP